MRSWRYMSYIWDVEVKILRDTCLMLDITKSQERYCVTDLDRMEWNVV